MGSREAIFIKFAPGEAWSKLFMNFESDLEKVISKTPFCPPKGTKWGQLGPNPFFLPNHCHIHREGTFLEVLNSGKVRFLKIWFLDPIWPPKGVQWGPNGAKSYFLPDLHHFYSEETFLQVTNNGKVKFWKILILVPIWPFQGGPMGSKWGQILFFAQSSPFSQWRDLFANF